MDQGLIDSLFGSYLPIREEHDKFFELCKSFDLSWLVWASRRSESLLKAALFVHPVSGVSQVLTSSSSAATQAAGREFA